MSKLICLVCVVLLGLVGCSRPGSDLTEEQKRGLEVLGKVANPDPLQERFALAYIRVCERGMDSETPGMLDAAMVLRDEMDARKDAAGGKVDKALAAWAEAEADKSEDEIIAAWGPKSDASDSLKAPK